MTLQHEQVWRRTAIDFQGTTIVPLNRPFDFFAVHEHQDHRRMSINLLLVIINFSMSLRRRRLPLPLLHRGRGRLTRARLPDAPAMTGVTALAVTLLRPLTTGF